MFKKNKKKLMTTPPIGLQLDCFYYHLCLNSPVTQ